MLNHVQKLVLIPLEEWEKIKRQKYERNETSSSEFTSSGESEYFSNESDSKKESEWKKEYLSDTESNDEKHFYSKSDVQRFKSSKETLELHLY